MFKVFGISLIVLALALAIVPHFTDCQSQGNVIKLANGSTTPMKCHWTGIAEAATAAPLLAVGAIMSATRRKMSYLSLSIMGLVLAGAAISLPTFAIGVCAMPTHICNTAMKPAILSLGSLVGLVSIVGIVISTRKDKEL